MIIDLDRAGLLEDMFGLPHEFVVPDLLFARELAGDLGNRLLAKGLRVEALTSPEVARATGILRTRNALSTPDTFAFSLAESRQWVLLTGDGELRKLAQEQNVEMHGVLWLFDQFYEGGHVNNARLHAGLTALHNHPRCRLPAAEIRRRLVQYII